MEEQWISGPDDPTDLQVEQAREDAAYALRETMRRQPTDCIVIAEAGDDADSAQAVDLHVLAREFVVLAADEIEEPEGTDLCEAFWAWLQRERGATDECVECAASREGMAECLLEEIARAALAEMQIGNKAITRLRAERNKAREAAAAHKASADMALAQLREIVDRD